LTRLGHSGASATLSVAGRHVGWPRCCTTRCGETGATGPGERPSCPCCSKKREKSGLEGWDAVKEKVADKKVKKVLQGAKELGVEVDVDAVEGEGK